MSVSIIASHDYLVLSVGMTGGELMGRSCRRMTWSRCCNHPFRGFARRDGEVGNSGVGA